MKTTLLFIFLLLFLGCFKHWEAPSSKVAKQADNYLENERDGFFYQYCYLSGDALNCLIDKESLEDCKEPLNKAQSFQKANYENAKRFISPDSVDRIRLRQSSKELKKLMENEDTEGYIDFLKEGFQHTIDTFTENEWEKCKEVA